MKTLIILSIILTLSACTPRNIQTPAEVITQQDLFANHAGDAARFAEIFAVSQDNPFVFATKEHILAMLDYGTGVIAFGFPACPHCHNAFPILERTFKEMHMHHYAGARGRILYYDILEDRAQNSAFYQTLVSYLSDYLLDDAEGNPRIFVLDNQRPKP